MLHADSRPEIDLISGEFYAHDAHAAFRWMRENDPLHYDAANDIYGVSLHEDIMTTSKDSKTYCSGRGFRPNTPNMPMMMRPRNPTLSSMARSTMPMVAAITA